jgi:hypothetical protein
MPPSGVATTSLGRNRRTSMRVVGGGNPQARQRRRRQQMQEGEGDEAASRLGER